MSPPPRALDDDQRLFTIAFVILSIAGCVPIWISEYLPLLDLPNHLSAVTVWHYHDDPNWHFKQYYQLNLVPLPYWAHYYTVHLLTYLTRDVSIANKIFLTGYALALPVAALLLARRFGRSHWLVLFVFPLVWNFNLGDGFIAYCAGFAAVPLALTLVDKYCEKPDLKWAIAVILIGSSTYFFHLLAYALFLVCAGLIVLMQAQPWRPRLLIARALPVLSCAGIGLWALRRANDMNFHRVTGEGRLLIYDPLASTLSQIPERLIDLMPGSVDELVVVVLVLCWLGLAITGARQPRDFDPVRDSGARAWAPEACMLGAFALYVATPRSMQRPFYWHMINGRFVIAFTLFAIFMLRGRITNRRRIFLVPVFIFVLVYDIALCRAFVNFNRHAAGFDALVDRVPRDKSLLTLMLRPTGDDAVNVAAFNQFPSLAQIRHGGYNHYNFAEGFPLRYKTFIPAPPWSHAEDFDYSSMGKYWDYFLTFREGWVFSPMDSAISAGNIKLIAKRGEWRLYENVGPRDTTSYQGNGSVD
jgi:hypothetical protein